MPASQVTHIIVNREPNDCALVALAMLLGESYEDVLRLVTVNDRRQGKDGLWSRTMIRIAMQLGHTLKRRAAFDLETDFGILRLPDHAAVLRNGLVIEGNGTIWDADAYLLHKRVAIHDCTLLVCVE